MESNTDINFISGWHKHEESHVWSKRKSFLLIKNQMGNRISLYIKLAKTDTLQQLRIYDHYKEVEIVKCNCINEHYVTFEITSNDFLISVEVDEEIIPAYQLKGSDDRRKLGFCLLQLDIEKNVLSAMVDKIMVDREKSISTINESYFGRIYHDDDFRFFENFSNLKGTILDIGANIGQSAISLSLAVPEMKIISYEPNKLLQSNLDIVKFLLQDKFDYHLFGVGEKNEVLPFYVPFSNDIYFTEEGSFIREELDKPMVHERIRNSLNVEDVSVSIREFDFEIRNLNDLNIETYIIKIDTQGSELRTIHAIKDIITKYKPIILIEKTHLWLEILNVLSGYEIFFYDCSTNALTKNDTDSANMLIINREGTANKEINKILFKLMATQTQLK